MFTGLIEHTGLIHAIEPTAAGMRLILDPAGWDHSPEIGDSIAINGCCLTVAAIDGADHAPHWSFDAIPETLSKTTLGGFEPGRRVHLEHAARADTLLGGHIVQGHVDGLGEVISVQTGQDWRLRVRAPAQVIDATVPKGSIAIDGVSLTIADMSTAERWLEVALIPVTLAKTALEGLNAGDEVNLEADVMTKAVVEHLRRSLPALLDRMGADRMGSASMGSMP
jgi:riboflavin synthase